MNIPHHHINNAILYLQDSKETSRPWERWQFKSHGSVLWMDLKGHCPWSPSSEYRRKPKMIKVGDLEFPEPEKSALQLDQKYYYPSFMEPGYLADFWTDHNIDLERLENGGVHLTEAAARAHSEAIWSLTK